MEELKRGVGRTKGTGPSLVMTSGWEVPRSRRDLLEPKAEDLISMCESLASGVYVSLYVSHGKANIPRRAIFYSLVNNVSTLLFFRLGADTTHVIESPAT